MDNQIVLFIALILSLVLSVYAQIKVNSSFRKYSRIGSQSGMTGYEVAKLILDRNGIYDVSVQQVGGSLTDHYDPRSKVVRLSETVYGSTSIAAVSVAAHEVGHAIQDNESYGFLRFRTLLAPVASFVSRFVYILLFAGFMFEILRLVDIAIIMFTVAVLFQVITLPVEFNASRRAMNNLDACGLVSTAEYKSSRKVLSAAALTYVAATTVSIINLLRLIALRGNRD